MVIYVDGSPVPIHKADNIIFIPCSVRIRSQFRVGKASLKTALKVNYMTSQTTCGLRATLPQ